MDVKQSFKSFVNQCVHHGAYSMMTTGTVGLLFPMVILVETKCRLLISDDLLMADL